MLTFLPAFSAPLADERVDYFANHVRPLLIQHCVGCHGPKKQEPELQLDSQKQVVVSNNDQDAIFKDDESDY